MTEQVLNAPLKLLHHHVLHVVVCRGHCSVCRKPKKGKTVQILKACSKFCITYCVWLWTWWSLCTFSGLARTVYINRIWPYLWWFPCQKYCVHTVYIYVVQANPIHLTGLVEGRLRLIWDLLLEASALYFRKGCRTFNLEKKRYCIIFWRRL